MSTIISKKRKVMTDGQLEKLEVDNTVQIAKFYNIKLYSTDHVCFLLDKETMFKASEFWQTILSNMSQDGEQIVEVFCVRHHSNEIRYVLEHLYGIKSSTVLTREVLQLVDYWLLSKKMLKLFIKGIVNKIQQASTADDIERFIPEHDSFIYRQPQIIRAILNWSLTCKKIVENKFVLEIVVLAFYDNIKILHSTPDTVVKQFIDRRNGVEQLESTESSDSDSGDDE
jgi:hypothetical protein